MLTSPRLPAPIRAHDRSYRSVTGRRPAWGALSALAAAAALATTHANSQEGASPTAEKGAPMAEPTEATLPPVRVRAQVERETAGGRVNGYAAKRSGTAMRGDIALRDTPQAVTVITADALADLSLRTIDEVADYVAGVDREAAQANPYALSFYIRGFNTAGAASSYNGFREYGFETPQSAVNIERIEFLKGPASVLYGGAGALSGLVNIVSKLPQPESRHDAKITFGSFGHRRAQLDTTGALDAERGLLYRLTAETDKDGNFVDGVKQESHFLSPVVTWHLSPSTRLDVEAVIQRVKRPGREPYFSRHPDFFRIPLTTQLGDPDTEAGGGGDLNRDLGRVELRHELGNGLTFRQGVFAQYVSSDDSTIQTTGYDPATQLVSRRVRDVDSYDRTRISQSELSGDTTTGSVRHQWLAGFEAGKLDSGYRFIVAPYSPINLFAPTYPGSVQGPLVESPWEDSNSEFQALYAQDMLSLNSQLKLVLGARYDRLRSWAERRSAGSTAAVTKDSDVSPRLGVVWQPNPTLSAYASWTESFRANRGTDAQGQTFDPQTGQQAEVGAKFDLSSGLSGSVAVFEYVRGNVPTTDPANTSYSILVGEQRSRGLELETSGRLMTGLDIIANYTYLDARVTKDNRLPVGDRLTGIPRHAVGLFGKLSLARFGVQGLAATLGVSHATDRPSGLPNDPDGPGPLTSDDVKLPSYTTANVGLHYETRGYSVRLVGRNVNNARIYDGYNSTFQPRAPRSWSVEVGATF
jgi:iron complex outermembrane receptor protein